MSKKQYTFAVLLFFLLLQLVGCKKRAEDAVIAEIQGFVTTTVEKAIALFTSTELKNGKTEHCFIHPGAIYLRHRCCVYYSNIAASLLYLKYGPDDIGDFDFNNININVIDYLFRLFAVQNDQREGIYSVPITVAGISGKLIKCEVLDVHTYLIFVSSELEDIIVDVTYRQFFYIPDLMEESYYDTIAQANLLKDKNEVFVGTRRELNNILSRDSLFALHNDLLRIHGKVANVGEFSRVHSSMDIIFSEWAKNNVCGKPTQRHFGSATDPTSFVNMYKSVTGSK